MTMMLQDAAADGIVGRLLAGLGNTVLLTLGGAAVALLAAFTAGLLRLYGDAILRGMAGIYIAVFRGTSALVQLFWFYFALRPLIGIELHEMTVGIVVLGLNVGAYGAEVVRGAVQAVPRGQVEAAIALNLSRRQRLWRIVLPQAVLPMLPPFGNLLIELLKATALVSMINVTDLTRFAIFWRDHTQRTEEIFGGLLVVYFVIATVLIKGVRGMEGRLRRNLEPGGTA